MSYDVEQPQRDLSDYLTMLRRRRLIILATVAVAILASLLRSAVETPTYVAHARVLLERPGSVTESQQNVGNDRELETQAQFAVSQRVGATAAEALGVEGSGRSLLSGVSAGIVSGTQILQVSARSIDPQRAAEVAQAFADAYLTERLNDALKSLIAADAALQAQEQQLAAKLDDIDAQRLVATEEEIPALDREEYTVQSQLGAIAARRLTLPQSQEFVRGGGEILRPAEAPQRPAAPQPARDAVLAGVLGLLLGLGGALVIDQLDDRIRSKSDAELASGAPVLGLVPEFQDETGRPILLTSPQSAPAEAFHSLRATIRFLGGVTGGPAKSLLLTSADAGEGKTTVAANLAIASASVGKRVILVGLDMRRPTMHRMFGLPPGSGLSDLLAGTTSIEEVAVDVGITNLRIITAGSPPPNPSELIASTSMRDLMAELEGQADLVIYDCPPCTSVSDALDVAPLAGTTVLVASARGRRSGLRDAAARIRNVGGRLGGVVINRVTAGEFDNYANYAYYYTED